MSSATRFAAVASLVGLIVAARPARDAGPMGAASLIYFTDRAAFQAQTANMTSQDFSQGQVGSGTYASCPGPLDATSNPCFPAGAIQPGVRFNSSPVHTECNPDCELILLGQGAFGAPSKVLVTNYFGNGFVLSFPTGKVGTVGADLVTYFTDGTCTIQIFGANGLLGSTSSPCTHLGAFWGVKADAPIDSIVITQSASNVAGVADVTFGAGAPSTINVVLDVKPGSDPSPVNPRSQGVTPVAVLGTPTFDAAQLDVGSLAFGPGAAPAVRDLYQDVNGDGIPDLVVHFSTQAANIACGDTQLTMTGRTLSGRKVAGSGAIQTVGCTKS